MTDLSSSAARSAHVPLDSRTRRRNGVGRRFTYLALLVGAILLLQPASFALAVPATVGLGTADSFSVLAGSTVTNTGPTVISADTGVGGNLGVSPGSAVTGFPPGDVTPPGTIHVTDGVAGQAQSDLTTAYNDAAGVTRDFTLNMLVRINRELDADFDLSQFQHRARYNALAGRIETHIVSRADQVVHIGKQRFAFTRDEAMLVEYSCKYALEEFAAMAAKAGLRVVRTWSDSRQWFAMQMLERA